MQKWCSYPIIMGGMRPSEPGRGATIFADGAQAHSEKETGVAGFGFPQTMILLDED
jgi:hypothetical protein